MNPKTLLLRQVNPAWIQAGRISSQAFVPTLKDNGKLSVYNGDRWKPSDSHQHFESQGLLSMGVAAASCHECQKIGIPYEEDNIPFEGHCFMDFRSLGSSAQKRAGKKLAKYARERGFLFTKPA